MNSHIPRREIADGSPCVCTQSRFWVREFLVDLLGCFVPGLIFAFLAAIVVVWPFVRIYEHLIHDAQDGPMARIRSQTSLPKADGPAPGGFQNQPVNLAQGQTLGGEGYTPPKTYRSVWETFGAEIVILIIAFSYAVGFLFFHADPSLPDVRGIWASRNALVGDEPPAIYIHADAKAALPLPGRTAMNVVESFFGARPGWIKELERNKKVDVRFPYLNIREYLTHRNLDHLAKMIPWDAGNRDSWRYRTKAFINILKIRLEFVLPDKCASITRNEAHIRLMSSVWYMARLVQWLALVSMCLVVLAVLTVCPLYATVERGWEVSAPCLGWSALVVAAMWYVRVRIERGLHYMRVREIVYVLETAYSAAVCGIRTLERGRKVMYPEILRDLGQNKGGGSDAPPSA